MEQYQNEWEEISQIIEEHINLMMRMYLETGSVFKCIFAKIGFFPYAQCLGKVMLEALAVGNMKTLDLLVPHKAETNNPHFPCIQTRHQYADRTLAQGQQRFRLCRSEGKKICIWKEAAMGTGDSRLLTCNL